MICPCCNEEMKKGFVMGIRRLAWSEHDNRRYALFEQEDEITIASGMNIAKAEAYRCPSCRVILMFDEKTERDFL